MNQAIRRVGKQSQESRQAVVVVVAPVGGNGGDRDSVTGDMVQVPVSAERERDLCVV